MGPVVGPSEWLPERDLIATITRLGHRHELPAYRLDVRGEPIGQYGTLDMARFFAECEIGEPLRWEQVSATRHEAWSHRAL